MAATEVGETLAGRKRSKNAEVAQLVEQPIRNRQVGGSSPPLGSILFPLSPAESSSWLLNISGRIPDSG
jgi:hypothetical protein